MKNIYAFFAAVLMTAILASPIVTGEANGTAAVIAMSAPVVIA